MSLYSHFSRLGYGKKTCVNCTVSRRIMWTRSQLHYKQSSPDYLIWPFPKKQHKHKTMLLEQSVYFSQLKEYHLYHPFFQSNAGQNVCVCYYGRIASYPSPWYWGNTFTYIQALFLWSISLFTNAKIKAAWLAVLAWPPLFPNLREFSIFLELQYDLI